jgi:hypothetical protein
VAGLLVYPSKSSLLPQQRRELHCPFPPHCRADGRGGLSTVMLYGPGHTGAPVPLRLRGLSAACRGALEATGHRSAFCLTGLNIHC